MTEFKKQIEVLGNNYYKLMIIEKSLKYSFIKKASLNELTLYNINHIFCNNLNREQQLTAERLFIDIFNKANLDTILCFYNLETLFREEYRFDIVTFLKEKSKIYKICIIWPGGIKNTELIYSRHERPDYYIHKIDNYIIYKENL